MLPQPLVKIAATLITLDTGLNVPMDFTVSSKILQVPLVAIISVLLKSTQMKKRLPAKTSMMAQ